MMDVEITDKTVIIQRLKCDYTLMMVRKSLRAICKEIVQNGMEKCKTKPYFVFVTMRGDILKRCR